MIQWSAQMNGNVLTSVLALIPYEMQSRMGDLELAVSGELTTCAHIDEFTRYLSDGRYSVVLVPGALPAHEWWHVWGLLTTIDPQPSILVYALNSDFHMWSGVLEVGGFDVIVAPFTAAKLRVAITSAAEFFVRRPLE
jgi:DNA-binding NtrC family response regulator